VHELSVCQALLSQVAEIARAQGAGAVEEITIEVGPLCGTEPLLLLSAFSAMRSGATANAELRIKHCSVSIRCLQCEARTETRPNHLVCGACGGWRTRVVAGDELRLLKVAIRLPGPSAIAAAGCSERQYNYV
jgi:hydrogenase nickel incorporation protein HypA/HybF